MDAQIVKYNPSADCMTILNSSNLSISEKLRIFEAEGRKLQTIYYNLEPSLRCRTFQPTSEDSLKQFQYFIKNSVFCGIQRNYGLEQSQMLQADDLSADIFKKYKHCKEITISVVWVFCYIFNTDSIEAYPVLQIQKIVNSSPEFIDWNKKKHLSWTAFLDNYELPIGLICVPKEGIYEWSSNSSRLCLEYFSTALAPNKANRQSSRPFARIFIPHFYKNMWLKEIYDALHEFRSKIMKNLSDVWTQIKPLGKVALVVGLKFIVVLIQYQITNKWNIEDLIIAFIDLMEFYVRDVPNNFSVEEKKVTEYFKNFETLKHQLSQAGKVQANWKEISALILKILEPLCEATLLILPLFTPKSVVLEVALKLFGYLFGEGKQLLSGAGQATYKTVMDDVKNGGEEKNDSELARKNMIKKMYDDFLIPDKNNEVLFEKNSAGSSKLYTSVIPREQKTDDTVIALKVEETLPRMFAFKQNTLAGITEDLRKILGSDFILENKEICLYHVKDSCGRNLGSIHFVHNEIVMGCFEKEALNNHFVG